MLIGYGLGYSNQVTSCFNVKFNWTSPHDKSLYEGIIGSAITLGMTAGALSGGQIMKHGRRRANLIASLIGMVGVCISLFQNFYAIVFGRVIFGFSIGIFSSICPRVIEETVPAQLYDMLAPIFPFS